MKTSSPPDIFLSYSREDQSVARHFAEAFEQEGLSVWWDQTLRSGEAYDEVTENALRSARAVVVLWSKSSTASRWVRAEATIADRQKTLLPAMIEDCNRPVMFELTQTADLVGWKQQREDPRWRAFVGDIRRHITGVDSPRAAPVTERAATPSPRRLSGVHVAIAAIVLGAIVAMTGMFRDSWKDEAAPKRGESEAAGAGDSAALQSASVAVLPFANLTGDAEKEYFSDGMAEELINALAKVPGLKVASRTSTFAYKGRNTDIRQIARDLGVTTILEGSVRSAGDRVRVTAQLINAESGYHLWSETYDRDFKDLFTLQDDLARQIVTSFRSATGTALPDYESQGSPTKDVDAYSQYLQGVAMVNSNNDRSLQRAIELMEAAIARDPGFARAYLAKAVARFLLGGPNAEVERDAARAVELDPSLKPTASLLAAGVQSKQGNWVRAEELIREVDNGTRPLEFPGFGSALTTWWPMGKLSKVLEAHQEGQRRAPASAAASLLVAQSHSSRGENELARKHAEAALALGVDPTGRRIRQLNADLALRAGDYDAAARGMIESLPPSARELGADDVVRRIYAAMQDPAKAPQAVADLERLLPKLGPEGWTMKVWAMNWFSRLGRNDLAFKAGDDLRLQFSEQSPVNAWSWLWFPELHALRRDPGFADFVARLGMVPYWQKYGPPDNCELRNERLVCT
jgi:TolB-like protein